MKKVTQLLFILATLAFIAFNYQNCGQQEFSSINNSNKADTDFDGLDDEDEISSCTIETNEDTDGDGLLDGEEVTKYNTDPCEADTDKGGTNDGDEVAQGTNPVDNPNDDIIDVIDDVDTDKDGLLDSKEDEIGTDKNNPDTDGDGLSDGREYNGQTSDPLKFDTDGGGIHDGLEVLRLNTDAKDAQDDNPIVGSCSVVFNQSTALKELVCIGGLFDEPVVTFKDFAEQNSEVISPVFEIKSIEKAQEPTSECKLDDGEYAPCVQGVAVNYKDLALGEHTLTLLVVDIPAGRKDIFEYKFNIEEGEPEATPEPVDGEWSPWVLSQKGSCSADCKRDDRYTRTCTPPQNGGRECEGLSEKQESKDCSFGEGLCEAPKTPGSLSVSPSSLNFANVDINKTKTAKVRITNIGQEVVKFASALSVSGNADFKLFSQCGNEVAAGAGCDVNIVFSPTVRGNKSASLSALYVSGDDTTAKPLSVPMSAVADHVYTGRWIVAVVDCSSSPGSPAQTLTPPAPSCSNGDCDPAQKPEVKSVNCPAVPFSGSWVAPNPAACATAPGTAAHTRTGAAVYCPSGKVCNPATKPARKTTSCPAVGYSGSWVVPKAPACSTKVGTNAYTSYGAAVYCPSGKVCNPATKPAKASTSCKAVPYPGKWAYRGVTCSKTPGYAGGYVENVRVCLYNGKEVTGGNRNSICDVSNVIGYQRVYCPAIAKPKRYACTWRENNPIPTGDYAEPKCYLSPSNSCSAGSRAGHYNSGSIAYACETPSSSRSYIKTCYCVEK